MKVTVYLPDELAEQVKAEEGLNISGVCQKALAAELHQREVLAKIGNDMERVEVYVDGLTKTFVGKQIGYWEDGKVTVWVYLTRRGRIAIADDRGDGHLGDYDDLDDAEEDGWPQELLAIAADAMGINRPIELDI